MKRRIIHLSPLIAAATLAFVFAAAQTNQSTTTSQSSSGNGRATATASSQSSSSGSRKAYGSGSGSGSSSNAMRASAPTHVIAYTPAQNGRTLTDVGRERVLNAQAEYLQRLAQDGKVAYHGPWRDMPGALTVLSVRTDDEAKQIAAGDPAVLAGFYETEVRAWKVTIVGSGRPIAIGR